MTYLKLLLVITFSTNFFLENSSLNKKNYLLINEIQEEWSSTPTMFTTQVKIVCKNSLMDIYYKSKNHLTSKRITVENNNVVLNSKGKSSIVAYKGLTSINGGQKIVIEFKDNEVIVYKEKFDTIDKEWKLTNGVSDLAIELSKKLKTEKLLYK